MGSKKLRNLSSRREKKSLVQQKRRNLQEIQYKRFFEKQRESEKSNIRYGAIAFVGIIMVFSVVSFLTYNWFTTSTATQGSPTLVVPTSQANPTKPTNPTPPSFSEDDIIQIAFRDQNVSTSIDQYINKYGATPTTKVSKTNENTCAVFFYRKYSCHTESTPCLKAVIDTQRRVVTSVEVIS